MISYNLAQLLTLGWLDPREHLCEWKDSGNFLLNALHLKPKTRAASGDCHAVKLGVRHIQQGASQQDSYLSNSSALLVSYRSGGGVDAALRLTPDFVEKIYVHLAQLEGFGHRTYLVAMLSPGEVFAAPHAYAWDSECGAFCYHLISYCKTGAAASAHLAHVATASSLSMSDALDDIKRRWSPRPTALKTATRSTASHSWAAAASAASATSSRKSAYCLLLIQ